MSTQRKTKTVHLAVEFKRYGTDSSHHVIDPTEVTDVGPTLRKRVSGGYKSKTIIGLGDRKIAVESTQEEVLEKINWRVVS